MRCLFVVCTIAVCLSTHAAQPEIPRKITDYLKATEEEAAIPLWDLGYEPNLALVYGSFRETLHVGKLGFVQSVKVHQVIDGNSARVALQWRSPRRYRVVGPAGQEYYKLGDVGENNAIVRGISTSGMVDDSEYRIDKILEISGTEQYATANGGTKTVFVFKPVDIEPFTRLFTEAADTRIKLANAEKQRATEDSRSAERDTLRRELTRKWTDLSGKFTTTGQLVGFLPGQIAKIQKVDGGTIEIKLEQLSREDRIWINDKGMSLLVRLQMAQ